MTRWIAALAFASSLLAACSSESGSGGGDCSSISLPTSCPTSNPSYATAVAPLLKTYCVTCHVAGGVEPTRPLDTQPNVAALASDVANEVVSCGMPQEGSPMPTAAERQVILDWIACGAQNN